MRPRDAMASAGKTLVELFGLARELNVDAEGIDMGPSPTDAALAADLVVPIEELDLTVRSYNCLKREGVHSVGELVARSEADLLDIRNFGAKSIDEVKAKLANMGLALKDSPPGFNPSAAADAFGADNDADGASWRPSSTDAALRPTGNWRVGEEAGSGACSCKAEEGVMAEPSRPTTTRQMCVPDPATPPSNCRSV